jgi:hypothetical protein
MSSFSDTDAYNYIKMQSDFGHDCFDCIDWAEWTPIRWRYYCNAVANNESVDYILNKDLWDQYILTL